MPFRKCNCKFDSNVGRLGSGSRTEDFDALSIPVSPGLVLREEQKLVRLQLVPVEKVYNLEDRTACSWFMSLSVSVDDLMAGNIM
ncbi:hypothetical protein CFIMG_004169RAa [Ceratocystis fimbriata CBS 114723]|uniref:Uncharacterized protein n=1 Tax=Ceratocystis fimbriata CBS 114723 TaxID=1035309 RepID=A0A2C5X2I8_9PEZI|nr:hypothetical protein CFIMG_004169RAa [Ceratocystis fimbriata CBS 114723]